MFDFMHVIDAREEPQWGTAIIRGMKGRVCIASRGEVKKLCLEAVFEHKRG